MDPLVRILNDDDRHAFAWLDTHAGRVRVTGAIRRLTGAGRPVYVSALCRYLGVWPPARSTPRATGTTSPVADLHLARIRAILAQRGTAVAGPSPVSERSSSA
ncbi:hypothetical protein [Paraburkholderia fungorum]